MRTTTDKGAVIHEMSGDYIAVVNLNRPEKRNAINFEIGRGLKRFHVLAAPPNTALNLYQ